MQLSNQFLCLPANISLEKCIFTKYSTSDENYCPLTDTDLDFGGL